MKIPNYLHITWRSIVDRKISILIYCLTTVGLLWMYIAMFPSIQAQAENMQKIFSNYPEAFLKVFNVESMNFTRLESFLAVEQFSIVWPIMVIFFMVSFAGTSISGEIEKGTIEIILSRPVSRVSVFLGKYLAGSGILVVFTAFSIFSIIPLARLHGIHVQPSHYLSLFVVCLLFGWAVFSLAMLFSSLFSERSKTYMFTGGILVFMYVMNIIATLKDNLHNLKYISFFHYFGATTAIENGTLSGIAIVVFIAVAIVGTAVAAMWLHKRNVAV